MKIAHIQLLPLLTGVQRVSLEELKRLCPSKFERYLICKCEGDLTKATEDIGVTTLYAPSLTREIRFFKDISAFTELVHLFRFHKFDVVHTHSSKTGVLGRIAAKIAKVPLIVHTVHGFSFPAASNPITKFIYYIMEMIGGYFSDVVICLHEEDKQIAIQKLKIHPNKVFVIANGVDTEYFSPTEKELPTTGTKIIGMVGRLWPQKDPLTLVRAAIEVLKVRDDVEFQLIGGGELEAPIKELIFKSKMENKIKLLGWCSNVNVKLRDFDVFVLPSLWEGMPLAILEAQSTRLPCVVSDIPGNKHLVTNMVDGLLFSKGDANSLKEKLLMLLDEPSILEKMGKVARNKVLLNYDINARTSTISSLYEFQLKLKHEKLKTL